MTTISQERTKLAKVGLTLRRREQWGARFNYTTARSVDEPATRVFVHISVTNPGAYSSNDVHARAIENIGINRFPSTGISYNRLVMPDGSLYEGQPIGRRGAHTVNDFRRSTCSTSGCPGRGASLTAPSWNLNINSRAYVICQNTQHAVTDKMVDSLARAIAADAAAGFVTEYAALRPHGHRCVSSKSCPGNLMWVRMGSLKTKIAAYLTKPASIGGGSGGTTIPNPTVPSTGFTPEDDMPLNDADKKWLADQMMATVKTFFGGRSEIEYSGVHYTRDDAQELFGKFAGTALNEIRYKVLPALGANDFDIDALATTIAAKLPTTAGSIDLDTVKQGVRDALREGIGDAPA